MKHLLAKDLSPKDTLEILTGGVGPRPIALVSTLSKKKKRNLAPFSFF
ncbi:MAG: flavin reductase family protein, partial [Deltaproteobacteria bacterium]|nr:flavin reductase family protein [Deltaproteobacteria bacterium]